MTEYIFVYNDIINTIQDLDEWMKPRPVEKDLLNKLNTIYLQPEPYGTVLVVSPWNYPFQLAMVPLIGAIAAGNGYELMDYIWCIYCEHIRYLSAGNAVVLKAGEMAVLTSNLLAELIPKYLDSVSVISNCSIF